MRRMSAEEFREQFGQPAEPKKKRRKGRDFQEQYADAAKRKPTKDRNIVAAWVSCPFCGHLCGGKALTYDDAHAAAKSALEAHRCQIGKETT